MEKKAQLSRDLRRVRAELKKLESEGKHPPAEKKLTCRCYSTQIVAQLVCHLAQGDEAMALVYVRTCRRHKQVDMPWTLEELKADWHATGEEAMAVAKSSKIGRQRLRVAARFVLQQKLQEWTQSTNLEKALTPSSQSVLRRIALATSDMATALAEPLSSPGQCAKAKGRLQWLRRWARRFAVTRGRFQAGSKLCPEDAHLKALCWLFPGFFLTKIVTESVFLGSGCGAAWRPGFSDNAFMWISTGGPPGDSTSGTRKTHNRKARKPPEMLQATSSWVWMNLLDSLCPHSKSWCTSTWTKRV
jgi:hypothetical protein